MSGCSVSVGRILFQAGSPQKLGAENITTSVYDLNVSPLCLPFEHRGVLAMSGVREIYVPHATINIDYYFPSSSLEIFVSGKLEGFSEFDLFLSAPYVSIIDADQPIVMKLNKAELSVRDDGAWNALSQQVPPEFSTSNIAGENVSNLLKDNIFNGVTSTDSSAFLRSLANTWNAFLRNPQQITLETGNLPSEGIAINFDKYEFKALQLVQDEEFMHVNIHVNNFKPVSRPNTITEEFNTKLDADILTTPQFVSNHRNKQRDIIVQDINNDLYLINNGGKILWKKQLDGNILGKVNQIDAYKNGRLQFVFNTPHRTYLIDRNGKDVGPFPLKFQKEITQPLSVFDYDSNKNYRLLVTQNDALLMYDARGKKITGFSYKKNNPILKQPKHFRLSGKDYIVFATAEKMKILNRRGKTRINIKESINFSNNDIYLYKNQFTTTSKKGELIQVNSQGVMSKQRLKLDRNHAMVATNKTLSFLSENYITIKQKTKQLDFGFYTKPVIFYLNDKIYVSVTDLQSKKVYLFDSSANIQNNFPVYGNSQIELENMDNDAALEILTTGDSNSIIVYQKN